MFLNLLSVFGGVFDLEALQEELTNITEKSERPELWDDPEKAKEILQKKTSLEKAKDEFLQLETKHSEFLELLDMAIAENDDGMIAEIESDVSSFAQFVEKKEVESLLCEEADQNNCYLEIHSGAGGTEAQDWVEMLLRMYVRWAEQKEYKVDYIEESPGDEAGLKSVTIEIKGHNAFGWLKTESGVHRLVRISPFDSNARRHTSFASVWVYPVIEDEIEIDIEDKDLRIDTYRASGAGGQHVNKTDSAVRITHLPTNIVVQCQNNRSQHRNKATAMNMLKARLYELELQKRKEEDAAQNDAKADIGWGHQIRSYVLHPYQMVKDLRTQHEKGNAQAVLDGDIDSFLEATLSSSTKMAS